MTLTNIAYVENNLERVSSIMVRLKVPMKMRGLNLEIKLTETCQRLGQLMRIIDYEHSILLLDDFVVISIWNRRNMKNCTHNAFRKYTTNE